MGLHKHYQLRVRVQVRKRGAMRERHYEAERRRGRQQNSGLVGTGRQGATEKERH